MDATIIVITSIINAWSNANFSGDKTMALMEILCPSWSIWPSAGRGRGRRKICRNFQRRLTWPIFAFGRSLIDMYV